MTFQFYQFIVGHMHVMSLINGVSPPKLGLCMALSASPQCIKLNNYHKVVGWVSDRALSVHLMTFYWSIGFRFNRALLALLVYIL